MEELPSPSGIPGTESPGRRPCPVNVAWPRQHLHARTIAKTRSFLHNDDGSTLTPLDVAIHDTHHLAGAQWVGTLARLDQAAQRLSSALVSLGVGKWGGVGCSPHLRPGADTVRNVVGCDDAPMRAIV